MTVRWRQEAAADLDDILAYIAERNPAAAARVADRIAHSIGSITEYPRAGRRDEDTGCHEWPVPGLPLLIVYQLAGQTIDIVAVFHTSRDPSTKRRG